MFSAFGILAMFVFIIGYAGVRLADLIPTYSDDFNDLTKSVSDWLSSVGVDQSQIDAATSSITLSDVSGYLVDIAGRLASVLSSLTFIAILIFFLAMDMVAFNERLGLSKRLRPDIGGAFESFVTGTRTYLVVATIFGAIVAVIDTAALALMGIPLAIVWGLVAFVTNYIPNIGFVTRCDPTCGDCAVAGRVPLDDRGHRRLQRHQLRHPVADPAQVRRRVSQSGSHRHVLVAHASGPGFSGRSVRSWRYR